MDQGPDRKAGNQAGQIALFDVQTPDPLRRVAPAHGRGVPVWMPFHVKRRALCQDCVQVTHEAWPAVSPPIRQARWRRKQGSSDRILCNEHARHWKEADGIS